jgi:hypothetical protein
VHKAEALSFRNAGIIRQGVVNQFALLQAATLETRADSTQRFLEARIS